MARAVVTKTIDYPDSDGLPMAENESQFWPILYVGSALDRHFQARDDVYVVGNLLLYYQEADPDTNKPGESVSPDLMVVVGAPKHVRSSYKLWEELKAPDFVLEIASESTWQADSGKKRDTYAEIGVSEYWQVDPVGACLRPPLQGFQLVGGHYEPIPIAQRADGSLSGRSEVLGLELHLNPDAEVQEALRFYDPVRGEPLRSLREAEQGREEAEQGREEAEARLGRAEGRLREEQAARQEAQAARKAAEARLQEVEAEVRALRRGGREPGQEPDDLGHGR